jgi:hypothetical protein
MTSGTALANKRLLLAGRGRVGAARGMMICEGLRRAATRPAAEAQVVRWLPN